VQTGPGGLAEARLRTLYVDQRLSKKAIARELGCSDTTAAAAVRHFRHLSRPERPRLSEQDRRLVVEMYKSERLAVRTIAEPALLRDADDAMYLAKGIRGSGSVMSVGR
jgi:hypothetical protein